jgi:hypothetical protein
MAIDINKDVKLLGAFTQKEFLVVALALAAAFLAGVVLAFNVSLVVGLAWIGASLGCIAWFGTYQAALPKGYLGRRLHHEGKFLFLKLPVSTEPAVYLPESCRRKAAFAAHLKEGHRG